MREAGTTVPWMPRRPALHLPSRHAGSTSARLLSLSLVPIKRIGVHYDIVASARKVHACKAGLLLPRPPSVGGEAQRLATAL